MSGAGTQVGALLDIYGFNSSVEVSVLSRRDIRIATHLLLCFHVSGNYRKAAGVLYDPTSYDPHTFQIERSQEGWQNTSERGLEMVETLGRGETFQALRLKELWGQARCFWSINQPKLPAQVWWGVWVVGEGLRGQL